jgi:2-keto-3-deoxy-6-phosphogluconate aldolase
MDRLHSVYRRIYEQGFLPIFTQNDYDSKALVEACVLAGCRGIEYTLRRRDAHIMIPWIREHYPDLCLLIGSTLDSESLVQQARTRHPQLLTMKELGSIGVDGFVSMVGFRPETLNRYSSTHLMIAPVSTMYEAYCAIEAGAHFVKVAGTQLELVKYLRGDATFGFCPIMVTGGMTMDRIPTAVEAGAVLIGSGFELLLQGLPVDSSARQAANALAPFLDATHKARDKKWPALAKARDGDFNTWLAALPHHHPFDKHRE